MPEIKYDSKNYRKHSEKNKRVIKKSVDELGAGRSILIDSENEIIAGNGVKEAWGNKPIRIIETDGNELIAVKRIDLKTKDKKRKTLALIDNHASDTSDFDNELIKEDFENEELNEWEFEEKEEVKKKEKQELQAYEKHHILISYPPMLHCQIIEFIEKISLIDPGIEIESASN